MTDTWVDDFDGPAGSRADPAIWQYVVGAGGNEQWQDYTDSTANAALDGRGCLKITARRANDGTVTSAMLITKHRLRVRYGRVEARIKVPAQAECWPAFWMLGGDIDEAGWPGCGEIDVMEYVAADPTRVHGTAHGPGYSGVEDGAGRAFDLGGPLADDFHRFAVEWTEGAVEWFVDDQRYHRLTPADVPGPWRLRQPFYLLLNLAIGGTWPGLSTREPELPATLFVDWVRITTDDLTVL